MSSVGADAAADNSGGGESAAVVATAGSVRCAYQRLCAVLLVHFPRRVVQLNDNAADAVLAGYRCHVEVVHPDAAAADAAVDADAAADAAMLPPAAEVLTMNDIDYDVYCEEAW
jgi:hypothetical protein